MASLRDELKWLADELGRVRDADVMLGRLAADAERLPEVDAIEVTPVLRRLARERTTALAEVHGVLDGERYLRLLERVVDAARAPKFVGDPDRAADKALVELAGAQWRKLRKTVDALGDEPADEELHEVRIKAKRARYAAEAASVVLPGAAAHAKAIAGVQDVLGEQHDAVVAEAWLRDAVTVGTTRVQAMAVGLLVALQRADAAERRGVVAGRLGCRQRQEAPGVDAADPSPPAGSRGGSAVTCSRCCWCTAPAARTGPSRRASARPSTATTSTPPCGRCTRRPACGARWDASCRPPSYRDHRGRPKQVRYWEMVVLDGEFAAQRRGRRDRVAAPRRRRGPPHVPRRPGRAGGVRRLRRRA